MGIRIDALDAAASAQADHVIPAMRSNETVKLTVEQIATYTTAAIVDSAPATLDTLNELAAALGDDPNFAATTAAAIGAIQTDITSIEGEIDTNSLTAKTTPVDADEIRIADSAASFGFKKLTFANLKAWILSWLPISKVYTSPEQTITSGAPLTLAHGLGVEPKFITCHLVCKVGAAGFSVGEKVECYLMNDNGAQLNGAVYWKDSTNVYLRFTNATTAYTIGSKTGGLRTGLTNSDWRLVVTAYA